MRNFLSSSKTNVFSVLLMAAAFAGPQQSFATDDLLFVQQVQSIQAASDTIAVRTTGDPAIDRIGPRRLNSLLPPLARGRANSSGQVQVGNRNVAIAAMVGGPNSTLQVQIGSELTSTIGIRGARNRVAVDQRGARLESDIEITGGNKAVLHIQRGRRSHADHQPITLDGARREAIIVLDTPRGRLTRTVNP